MRGTICESFKNTHNFTLCMICFPNCKINLGLTVTRKRPDGYHDIETVFYPVPVRDVLEIVPAEQTKLHMSGLAVAGDSNNNLVWKAYHMLKTQYPDTVPELAIYLHKVIPMGAGLGGGSADGAFMLTLLNDYCALGLSKPQLAELALQLGSDCPFFIYNTPQYAMGRGEELTESVLDLSPYSIQLICPSVHVSTAAAFAGVTPKAATYNLRLLSALPLEQWRDKVRNAFEEPVFALHPVLADIKHQLYTQGALYSAMSGSGSAVYGIFPKGQKAEVVADVPFTNFYID
jgi:4-diphosphocytidyl-2-C-methyl-D-erythritol kinase